MVFCRLYQFQYADDFLPCPPSQTFSQEEVKTFGFKGTQSFQRKLQCAQIQV